MVNLAESLEEEAGDEAIEVVVIGWWEGSAPWGVQEQRGNVPREKLGIPLPWAEARVLLNYEYDNGYGGADCHAVAAYTATKVICVYVYDGATGTFSLPRNPCAFYPPMPGGS